MLLSAATVFPLREPQQGVGTHPEPSLGTRRTVTAGPGPQLCRHRPSRGRASVEGLFTELLRRQVCPPITSGVPVAASVPQEPGGQGLCVSATALLWAASRGGMSLSPRKGSVKTRDSMCPWRSPQSLFRDRESAPPPRGSRRGCRRSQLSVQREKTPLGPGPPTPC